jgi:serine protease AprX
MTMKRTILLLLILSSASTILVGGDKIDARLEAAMNRLRANESEYAWVYLSDKGSSELMSLAEQANLVSERSLRRRAKVRTASSLVDFADLPVAKEYIEQLSTRSQRIRQCSKWLNAVSLLATKAQLMEIERLPFVRSIELMARFRKNQSEEIQSSLSTSPEHQIIQPGNIYTLDYGLSFGQNNQIAVPDVHNLGYNGTGVFVGVFDNGFRLPAHESFAAMTIHATYDFVDHKISVVPNNPSVGFGTHGVNTLSTIGGFKSGQLIGPAYGATFLLARTENDSSETPIEEDNWVAAIEWADSIGVDVTSTSLGYLDFDLPYTSWTWQNMNGNTTAITRAADAAVARGIVVVNSAGNEGLNVSHNTLGAPADGDSVLTIGAVTSSGTRSSFSSVGPTTSVPPRIKPDVMAQGSSVRVASSTNVTGYTYADGTSFSCPLAAGVAALVVQARPNATPIQVMNAMRNTASRSATPDNQYGWGIVNALAAITNIPLPIQLSSFTATPAGACVNLRWTTVSEVNNYGFELERSRDALHVTTVRNSFTPGHGTANTPHEYRFRECDIPSAVWYYRLKQMDLTGEVTYTEWIRVDVQTGVSESLPFEFALFQNYPNPFNPTTNIGFQIAEDGPVSLKVFDVLGRDVATIAQKEMQAGPYYVTFDAQALAGGVYFYTLKTGSFSQTKKFILAK